jgi:hypothetical protein
MQIGSRNEEGLILKTNFKNIYDLNLIKLALFNIYNIEAQIIFKNSTEAIFLDNYSWYNLGKIIEPYLIKEFLFLLNKNSILDKSFQKVNIENITKINSDLISPVKFYLNADINKEKIIKDNKEKSGVYR